MLPSPTLTRSKAQEQARWSGARSPPVDFVYRNPFARHLQSAQRPPRTSTSTVDREHRCPMASSRPIHTTA